MRILILNPPARERHLRGNHCSNVSKGVYYYPAVDLLVQSGILAETSDIEVCDAIAEERSAEDLLRQIDSDRFDGIFAVTGSSSRSSDLEFLRQAKERSPSIRILTSGGYLLTQHREVLETAPWIDGALLDFTSAESISFFRGENGPFRTLALRGQTLAIAKTPSSKEMRYPVPRHELFPLTRYHHPNARRHPFSLLLHSTGCPYTCDYCIYSIAAYRARPSGDVIAELAYLRTLGVREAFFHDPTFVVKRAEGLELCRAMTDSDLDLSWFCQTRVDLMDEELLSEMRRAGCHAIMFGVETADPELLKEQHRRIAHRKTEEVYEICRKLGIRTLSYLVVGLPGETSETIRATVDFVKKIRSDFVSFNLAIPVIGTAFRARSVEEGLTKDDNIEFDTSSSLPSMPTRHLSREELSQIHRWAVREFYFRPGYLVRRLFALRSWYEFRNQLREGWSLVRRWLKPGSAYRTLPR